MRVLAVCSVLVTTVFVSTCGSVSPTEGIDASVMAPDAMVPPDATPPDPCTLDEIPSDSYSECYVRAVCTYFASCTTSAESFDQCVEGVMREPFIIQPSTIQDAITGGKANLDGAKAKQCFDDFAQCSVFSEACSRMLIGQTPQNGDCVNSIECGLGGLCEVAAPPDQCKVGACQIPRREGQSCEGGLRCESGLSCVGPAGSLACSAGNTNDFCTSDFQCSDSNRCNEGAMVCEPRVAENAACTVDGDCVIPMDCVNNTCQRPDAVGDACRTECEGALVCREQLCVAAPLVGEACPERRCGNSFFTQCIEGSCVARSKSGESCTTISCELGLICEAGANVCRERTASGGTCVADNECAGFSCDAANVCEEYDNCY